MPYGSTEHETLEAIAGILEQSYNVQSTLNTTVQDGIFGMVSDLITGIDAIWNLLSTLLMPLLGDYLSYIPSLNDHSAATKDRIGELQGAITALHTDIQTLSGMLNTLTGILIVFLAAFALKFGLESIKMVKHNV